jgi:short-subunit dehydrogenase
MTQQQRILIIGATSAIASATARLYAARGASLFLVARDVQRLDDIAADLRVRGASSVASVSLDVMDTTRHAAAINEAMTSLGGVDVALIAHGTLPDPVAVQQSVDTLLESWAINATSVITLSTLIAQRLESQGSGTLAVIGSVAGDRGRSSNYVYGAAKAAIATFLSGLRQRLRPVGVHVLTIKPGFVDTPMTSAFKKGALWAQPDDIARGIVRAVEGRQNVVYLPSFWRLIMWVIRLIPEPIFVRLRF